MNNEGPRTRNDPSPELRRLAERQAGVLTTAQCHEFGLTRRPLDRLLTTGWAHLGQGIVTVQPPTFDSWCWAGLFAGGSDATLGGLTAAHRWGLVKQPDHVTVYTPHQRRPSMDWVDFVRTARPGVSIPRVSRPAVSVLDSLAHLDEEDVIALVTAANRRWRGFGAVLSDELSACARVRHRRLVELLAAPESQGVESPLEWYFLQDCLRAHGLPEEQAQVWGPRVKP